MQKVKAKFLCNSIIPNSWTGGKSTTAHFNAVYVSEGENADFAKATPCGNLSIVIDQDVPAATFFEQNKQYIMTFEKAD